MQKSFPSVSSKKVYPVYLRMHSEWAQKKLATHKNKSQGEFSQPSSLVFSNENFIKSFALLTRKSCTYTKKYDQVEIVNGNLDQKDLRKNQ